MEILSQTEIIEQVGGWPGGIVILLAVLVFAGLSFFFCAVCDLDTVGVLASFFITIFALILTMGIWAPKDVPTGRYEYKVILDETYPATQLYEKYEVVGQDGKIWIIQDKESKD